MYVVNSFNVCGKSVSVLLTSTVYTVNPRFAFIRGGLFILSIEDLNVSGMMKNRHLSKAVASQKFYEFRTRLKAKCHDNGIELRIVDRWYPSSRMCHCCGNIKKDLKLSDRIYRCDCGYIEDRDFNASLNLRDAVTYKVA
ncbi:MAG: transposase [Ruminobacter sp.]|nr:transposase [Ruminobacter sp.]